jgi:hypothetical protein
MRGRVLTGNRLDRFVASYAAVYFGSTERNLYAIEQLQSDPR